MEKRQHRDTTNTLYFPDIYRTFQSNTTCNNGKKEHKDTTSTPIYFPDIYRTFQSNTTCNIDKREHSHNKHTNIFPRYLQDFSVKYNLQNGKKGAQRHYQHTTSQDFKM
jgi:hypothetical protein